ncbi:MAG: hypothetical protein V7780_14020 [Colwellia sp.]|jgi:hypothetical protein|uniref:hypothetical protein n=1 Tax=Colwellia sp. Bg11-12 TaxID=2759817 RepID=UPI0015F38AE9|nr:hypothetical protein [Colwellia sp. Bg11-12]MBA6263860.1 hypothetical protein [Colwellia sp. Bg11-12]
MSPEQLKMLQRLSELFEQGIAGPSQIKQLSSLLAAINQNQEQDDSLSHSVLTHSRANVKTLTHLA